MILTILGAIWFYLILKWDVNDDYQKWLKEIPIDHTREGALRALLLVPSIVLLAIPHFSFIGLLITIALLSFTWLLFFDGWYNKKRNFSWWFLGSVDPDDAWWDKFQRKIPLKWLKILKIGIPVLLLILYLLRFTQSNLQLNTFYNGM